MKMNKNDNDVGNYTSRRTMLEGLKLALTLPPCGLTMPALE
jgi:hypothetical protein